MIKASQAERLSAKNMKPAWRVIRHRKGGSDLAFEVWVYLCDKNFLTVHLQVTLETAFFLPQRMNGFS